MKKVWLMTALGVAALGFVIAATVLWSRDDSLIVAPETPAQTRPPAKPEEKRPAIILFGGDIFLDRIIRKRMEEFSPEYLWENVRSFLEGFEYKIANLEGPIWNRDPAPLTSMSFAFQEAHARIVQDLGFTALSLANNHTLNQGHEALRHTRRQLDGMGILAFGDPLNASGSLSGVMTIGTREIALIGEHSLVADNKRGIIEEIRHQKNSGRFVIVYPHWGEEYVMTIPAPEQSRARAFIDAGADLVIGAHPHVVQPIEIYKNKAIFYSLGNLLFDQYFSTSTMQGLLVEARFYDDRTEFVLHPTRQEKISYRINLADEIDKKALFARLAQDSLVPLDTRDAIRENGAFTIKKALPIEESAKK